MIPLNLWDFNILQKYLIGKTSPTPLYGELLVAPKPAREPVGENEPRVVQLPDEDEDADAKNKESDAGLRQRRKPTEDNPHDID